MPCIEKEVLPHRIWGLWRIDETEPSLLNEVRDVEAIPTLITHPDKRLEYIAGRVLAKHLLREMNEPFTGILKDEHGKPLLKNQSLNISLSHSYPFVTALIDRNKDVGIDLEQLKPKLLKLGSRVFHPTELDDARESVEKHCIYWCAKEALIKYYGKKDLSMANDLLVEPFHLQKKGALKGKIILRNQIIELDLEYRLRDGFALVLTC